MKKSFLIKFEENRPCQGDDEWFEEYLLVRAYDANEAIKLVKLLSVYEVRGVTSRTLEE